MKKKFLKMIRRTVITILIIFIVSYTFTAIYIANHVYFDNKTKSDAIIVLGAKSFIDGHVNQCVKARVEHAVNLYNDGFASKIIMSGGTDKKPIPHDTNEGEEMKKMAMSMDVDPNDILVEGESTSTYENLIYSQQIMAANNLQNAIIVTEPFHSPRANLTAQKIGLAHSISPTQTSTCWNHWTYFSGYFLREPFAMLWYKLRGHI